MSGSHPDGRVLALAVAGAPLGHIADVVGGSVQHVRVLRHDLRARGVRLPRASGVGKWSEAAQVKAGVVYARETGDANSNSIAQALQISPQLASEAVRLLPAATKQWAVRTIAARKPLPRAATEQLLLAGETDISVIAAKVGASASWVKSVRSQLRLDGSLLLPDGAPRPVTEDERARAIEMLLGGATPASVARELRRAASWVTRLRNHEEARGVVFPPHVRRTPPQAAGSGSGSAAIAPGVLDPRRPITAAAGGSPDDREVEAIAAARALLAEGADARDAASQLGRPLWWMLRLVRELAR